MISHSPKLIKRALNRKWFISLVFSSIILLFNNPFFIMEGATRFVLATGVILFSILLSMVFGLFRLKSLGLLEALFALGIIYILLFCNDLIAGHMEFNLIRFQIGFMFLIFIASIFIAKSVDLENYCNSLLLYFGVIAFVLLLNFEVVSSPYSAEAVGEFDKDGYQRVGLVFGFCGILTFHKLLNWRSTHKILVVFFVVAFLVCFYVMLINRARGELIGFILACSIVVYPKWTIAGLICLLIVPSLFINYAESLDFPSINRLLYAIELGSDDARSILFNESISLLLDNPLIVLVGGGANYFQDYYGYVEGNYPHNLFLEAWISGGVVFLLVVVLLYLLPVLKGIVSSNRLDISHKKYLSLCVFFLVLSSKSGSINSSYMLAIATPFFIFLLRVKQFKLGWKPHA